MASSSKTKEKSGSKKSREFVPDDSGDEIDTTWNPPQGMSLVTNVLDDKFFDWDTLKRDENLEIWAIRVPKGMNLKHLQDVSLLRPETAPSSHLGQITPKKGPSYSISKVEEGSGNGGEEMKSLQCLLPRKKKGNSFFIAPIPITHHVVISQSQALPTPAPSLKTTLPASKRFKHDPSLLKHRFMPTGASVGPHEFMQVDDKIEERTDVEMVDAPRVKKKKRKDADSSQNVSKKAKKKHLAV